MIIDSIDCLIDSIVFFFTQNSINQSIISTFHHQSHKKWFHLQFCNKYLFFRNKNNVIPPGLALGADVAGRGDLAAARIHVTHAHAEASLALATTRVAWESHSTINSQVFMSCTVQKCSDNVFGPLSK